MPWFKVDDTLHGHPKTRRAGLAAMGMWVLAGSYSASYVTEGFIAEWWVSAFPLGKRRAAELTRAGFWIPGEKNGEQGWIFHDWNKFQPSKAEIEADRAAARDRQKAWRAKRRENASNAVTNGVTPDVTNGVSNGSPLPSRPDPIPARPLPSVTTPVETSHQSLRSVPRKAANE